MAYQAGFGLLVLLQLPGLLGWARQRMADARVAIEVDAEEVRTAA